MNPYQKFLDFFSMHNKERLDGLSEAYFSPMTADERAMAFAHLSKMVEKGGTEESVHGLFLADAARAVPVVKALLDGNKLRDEAAVAAAWNLYEATSDSTLIHTFIQLMKSPERRTRARAVHYAPTDIASLDLIATLQGIVRTETDMLTSINATNALLACYGITRATVEKEEYSNYYRGLRADDENKKEETFAQLEKYRLSR